MSSSTVPLSILMISRLAFSPEHGVGGLQDHVLDLSRSLARTGHRVGLITSEHPSPDSCDVQGVQVHCIQGARHDIYYPPEWWRGSLSKSEQLLSGCRYSIIHSHAGSGVEIMRQRVDHRYRVPMVTTLHGNTLGLIHGLLRTRVCVRNPLGTMRALLSAAKRVVDHGRLGLHRIYRTRYVITPSRAEVPNVLRTLRIARDRLYVVHHGVDTRHFRPRSRAEIENIRRERGISPSQPVLLMLGRVAPEKGLHVGVRALPWILRSYPMTKLLVVGDGEYIPGLRRIAATLDVDHNVCFVGPIRHQTTPEYFALSDVFLFPTLHDEAFGLVAAQAMACECPVVASRVGAVPEVVGMSGEAGILVQPGDVQGLARAVLALLDSRQLRESMGRTARRRVLQCFTLQRMVSETISVYNDILQRESSSHKEV